MAVSFVGLIVVVIVVILVVLGIARTGKKALILVPIILLGVVFFPAISFRSVSRVSSSYQPDLGMLQEDMQAQSAIWNEAVDDYLEADQYASMTDAAQFLGSHFAADLKDSQNVDEIVVYGQNPVTTRSLNAFSDRIRLQLSPVDIRVESYRPSVLPTEPNLIVCVLDVPAQQHQLARNAGYGGLQIDNSSGTLRLHVENLSNMDHSVEFLEKGWVNTLSNLHNSGHSTVMVARSSSSCTDEAEARDQAMSEAVRMTEDLLKQANTDYGVLDQEIKLSPQDLRAHQLVADQFSQSLRTSTTRVWRHALLLNLVPHAMDSLLQQKTRQIQRVHRSWAKNLLSLAGLALVVFILYIFLNAATKGYYAWSLRVIALVAIVGVVVVLFLV